MKAAMEALENGQPARTVEVDDDDRKAWNMLRFPRSAVTPAAHSTMSASIPGAALRWCGGTSRFRSFVPSMNRRPSVKRLTAHGCANSVKRGWPIWNGNARNGG